MKIAVVILAASCVGLVLLAIYYQNHMDILLRTTAVPPMPDWIP